jgi:hypothetical protein
VKFARYNYPDSCISIYMGNFLVMLHFVILSHWISKKWIFYPFIYEASSSIFDKHNP